MSFVGFESRLGTKGEVPTHFFLKNNNEMSCKPQFSQHCVQPASPRESSAYESSAVRVIDEGDGIGEDASLADDGPGCDP